MSGLTQISENILSPCLHHNWHGTGCQKRLGIFSRCNCLSLVSRLTFSAALPDTGKQDTDTDIVTADTSRLCSGFAMLRRVINWRIYYYYYYYYSATDFVPSQRATPSLCRRSCKSANNPILGCRLGLRISVVCRKKNIPTNVNTFRLCHTATINTQDASCACCYAYLFCFVV